MTESNTTSIRTVAVIGCGTVGAGWAALFLAGGLDVVAHDPAPDAAAFLEGFVRRARPQLAELGLTGAGRLSMAATAEEAVAHADLVQESAPESESLKSFLIGLLDSAAPRHAIIASSTSSLLWSAITGRSHHHPERIILAHPFNPAHLVPLVEIHGPDDAVVNRAMAFYAGLGKRPVRLRKEMRGHIANRLASALWREAVHMVEQGVASVADIDAALIDGPGLRWAVTGAHMTYHLAGGPGGIGHYLEHLGPSQERRWADLGQPHLTPPVKQALVSGIREEAAGRSVMELEAERDRKLVAILRQRRQAGP